MEPLIQVGESGFFMNKRNLECLSYKKSQGNVACENVPK